MKNTISIALAGGEFFSDIAPSLPETLANEATPDTDHFGEVMVVVEQDGVRVPQQRVSTPHLWEGTLFFLTALAAESPEGVTAYDRELPASRVLRARPRAVTTAGGGCDCAADASAQQTWWLNLWGLALVMAAAGVRRRLSDVGSSGGSR
jgi:MYXO-CTERM domain-containing protein